TSSTSISTSVSTPLTTFVVLIFFFFGAGASWRTVTSGSRASGSNAMSLALRDATAGRERGLEDLRLRAAATQVARARATDVGLAGRGVLAETSRDRDAEPRRADAAHGPVLRHELLLQDAELLRRAEALDRRDLPAAQVAGELQARVARLAVDEH